MAKCFIGWEQRALRAGASSGASPFAASNMLDPDFDRAWASTGITGEYLKFMTGDAVFNERVAAAAIVTDGSMRTADLHPTAGWVLCCVTTQLEIRTWNRQTGAVGADAIDTQGPTSGETWLAAKFSPDGRFILAVHTDNGGGNVRLRHFDPATGQIGAAITVPSNPTETMGTGARLIAWAANSLGFAALDNDDLNVWSFNTTTATATFVQARDVGTGAHCLAWHPNVDTTSYIVVGKPDSPYIGSFTVTLAAGVPTAVGTETAPGTNPGSDVTAVAFSPTGDRLACAVDTPKVYMYPWTTAFGTPWSAPATELASERREVVFGPEGDYVIFGGGGVQDPEVYPAGASSWGTKDTAFWDTPDCYQNSLSISADGRFLASVTQAGTVQITEFTEDPAAAAAVEAIALKGVNLTRTTQLRVRADTQADMASGSAYDTGTFDAFDTANVTQALFDQVDTAFGTNVYIVLPAAVTKKFWRIDITDAANPDGQFFVQYLLATVPLDRTRNFNIGSEAGIDDGSSSLTETDGGADVVRKRPARRQAVMTIPAVAAATALSDFWPLAIEGITRLVLFLPDTENDLRCHLQGFIGRLDQPARLVWSDRQINDVRIPLTEAR